VLIMIVKFYLGNDIINLENGSAKFVKGFKNWSIDCTNPLAGIVKAMVVAGFLMLVRSIWQV